MSDPYKPKGRKNYYLDVVVNGVQHRESLGTSDWRKARQLAKDRTQQLEKRPPDPAKRSKSYGSMDVKAALLAYAAERRAQVSPRMCAYWKEQIPALSGFFKDIKLRGILSIHISEYQNARLDAGKAPKTINGEVSVLRQLMKHAHLWYRFKEDYKPIPNHKPPIGQALTDDDQARLFEVAQSNPHWMIAYTAATLGFYCGARACELRGLKWKDVDLVAGLLDIRRSKTRAGWRTPTLNQTCKNALSSLYTAAKAVNAADPDHYVFPSHKGGRKIDPSKPITSWRTAWRSIRRKAARNDLGEVIYPALNTVRFHDGRHTAITTLAEKGVPDWIIQAQVGHVDSEMMKTYSHIRRRALDEAAAALEPTKIQPAEELLN